MLSSRIEGTQATLGELLAAEAGAVVERSPADLREVANYVAALEHGVKRLRALPLSLRMVRELHAKLMKGARGGQVRPQQVAAFRQAPTTPSNARRASRRSIIALCPLAQGSARSAPDSKQTGHSSRKHWRSTEGAITRRDESEKRGSAQGQTPYTARNGRENDGKTGQVR
jgi:hypothetical protein